jgi:hypothetical protein
MDIVYMAQKIRTYQIWILYQKYTGTIYLLPPLTMESFNYLKGIKKTRSHLSKNLPLEKAENIRNFKLMEPKKQEPQL